MKATATHLHAMAFTGGTLTMGYVDGAFLKQLSDDYASLLDNQHYLYPLFDVRHIALAAAVDAQESMPEKDRDRLYTQLVETEDTIKSLLLAKKNKSKDAVELEQKLDKVLNGIAADIKPGYTIDAALRDASLDHERVTTPYFIDSINYQEHEHDDKLHDAASKALRGKKNEIFFVVGGTDTLVMYGGKLTRRLIDEGIISPENGNKVVFLSSMKSFGYGPAGKRETPEGEIQRFRKSQGSIPLAFQLKCTPPDNPHIIHHPQYIGRLMRRAAELARAEENGGKKLPAGGYLLCPVSELCNSVGVHDVRESMKVQPHFIDAFRSKSHYAAVVEVGKPINIKNNYRPKYDTHKTYGDKYTPVDIAPPLINGNSMAAVLNYLQAMPDYPVMIVGGVPTRYTAAITDSWDYQSLDTVAPSTPAIPLERTEEMWDGILNVVRERAERGVPTYFVNPDRYDINKNVTRPLIDRRIWDDNDFLHQVQDAGGILVRGSTIDGMYQNIQRELGGLGNLTGLDKIKHAGGGKVKRPLNEKGAKVHIPMEKGDPIGIKYIPNQTAFTDGFKAASRLSDTMVIDALPGGVTPCFVASLVKDSPRGKKVCAAYEYANSRRRFIQFLQDFSDLELPTIITPSTNGTKVMNYAPADAFIRAGGHFGGDYTPAEIIDSIHQGERLDGLSQAAALAVGIRRENMPRGGERY